MWQPETVYLNTASYGLPPAPAWEALQAALDDWRGGRTSWEHWGEATTRRARRVRAAGRRRARAAWRSAPPSPGSSGTIAASLPAGRARARGRGRVHVAALPVPGRPARDVTLVPLDRLAEAIDAGTDLVAVSAVQSSTGEVADARRDRRRRARATAR